MNVTRNSLGFISNSFYPLLNMFNLKNIFDMTQFINNVQDNAKLTKSVIFYAGFDSKFSLSFEITSMT